MPIEALTNIFIEQYAVDRLREKGYTFEVYFDAHDVYSMIQGFWSLEDERGHFQKKFIDQDDAGYLTKGMAYFRRIYNIHIFKPHMLEISRLLDRDHCFPTREIPARLLEELFEYLQLPHPLAFELDQRSKYSEIRGRLRKLVKRSKNLFKAHYIFVEPKWTKRAQYLLTREPAVIHPDDKTYDFSSLTESNVFQELREYFNRKRGRRTVNNMRDSLSLSMLLETLRRYRKTDAKRIPLFLASSDVIREAVEESGFRDEFQIELEGESINLLKSPEFFLFDVIFSDNEHSATSVFLKLNELKEKRHLFAQGDYTEALMESIKKDMATFVDQEFYGILRAINENFDFDGAIAKLVAFQNEMRSEEFEQQFERERQGIVRALKEYAADLELFEDIWAAVEEIERKERNPNILGDPGQADIFRDTGLTRFSPPDEKGEGSSTKLLWQDLIYREARGQDVYNRAKQQVVRYLFDGIQVKDTKQLVIGCSVMWVFESYAIINKVLARLKFEYGNYTLAAIHAAALCMSHEPGKIEWVNKIIQSIEGDPALAAGNYKVWMALSYIHFRVWESENKGHFVIDKTPDAFESAFYPYFTRSIELVGKAYSWLKDKTWREPEKADYRNVKLIYLSNIHIYYISRAGSREQFLSEDLETRVGVLMTARNNPRYWQPAFDHTIATYFFRKYYLETAEEAKAAHFQMAKDYYLRFEKGSLFVPDRLTILKGLIDIEENKRKATGRNNPDAR